MRFGTSCCHPQQIPNKCVCCGEIASPGCRYYHSEAGAACADYRQQEPRNIALRSDLAIELGFNPGPLTSPAGRVLKNCKQRAFELIVAIHYRGLIQVAYTCTSANLCLACTNKADLCMLCAAYLDHADIIQGENLDVNG